MCEPAWLAAESMARLFPLLAIPFNRPPRMAITSALAFSSTAMK